MRVFIVEGVDNSGKSWIIDKLCHGEYLDKFDLRYASTHFPSDEMCESKEFKKLITNINSPNYDDIKINFIKKLIEEEVSFLRAEKDKGTSVVFIDRFLITSLVYQGSGLAKNCTMERIIIGMYEEMFRGLDISSVDFYNFIFMNKIQDDLLEINPTKKEFDNKADEIRIKLSSLLLNINSGAICSDYFDNIIVFDEAEFKNGTARPSDAELLSITDTRIGIIVGLI